MFVIDMLMESIVGLEPQRIVRPKAKQLNSKIPTATAYRERLECLFLRRHILDRLGRAHEESTDNMEAEARINVIDREGGQYMMNAEKKCQKLNQDNYQSLQKWQCGLGDVKFTPQSFNTMKERSVTGAISNVQPGDLEYGTCLTCHRKRYMHGCKFVERHVNISDNMDTDTGRDICRTGCCMHGKQMMRQQRKLYIGHYQS